AYKSLMIGYDGVSLFNFVYYRPQSEPPFHILKHLNDLDFLSKQPQYYYLAKWRPLPDVNKMPRYIRRGKPEQFDVEIVLPSVTIKEKGRLRIHTIEQIPEKIKLTALINGIELESTEDISAFYDNPYDKMISSEKYRKAWLFPIKVILNGVNKLEIKINSFHYIDVAFIDFSIE
ncbi:MAG: hypothetical protein JXB50_07240, partial [Spirochaetes bacterium]|nr:hypothetical protein [Spirochaetota bacterium]